MTSHKSEEYPHLARGYANTPVAWVLLVLAWVVTPFVNDRASTALVVVYVALLLVGVVYGLFTTVKKKSWLLGVFSVVTLAAWPIMLFVILRFFGI